MGNRAERHPERILVPGTHGRDRAVPQDASTATIRDAKEIAGAILGEGIREFNKIAAVAIRVEVDRQIGMWLQSRLGHRFLQFLAELTWLVLPKQRLPRFWYNGPLRRWTWRTGRSPVVVKREEDRQQMEAAQAALQQKQASEESGAP